MKKCTCADIDLCKEAICIIDFAGTTDFGPTGARIQIKFTLGAPGGIFRLWLLITNRQKIK